MARKLSEDEINWIAERIWGVNPRRFNFDAFVASHPELREPLLKMSCGWKHFCGLADELDQVLEPIIEEGGHRGKKTA